MIEICERIPFKKAGRVKRVPNIYASFFVLFLLVLPKEPLFCKLLINQ